MKINFSNGKFLLSFVYIIIYLIGLFGIPYLIINFFHISNPDLLKIVSISSMFLVSIVTIVYSYLVKSNSIDYRKKVNFFQAILYGFLAFIVMMFLQIFLSLLLQILAKIYGFNPMSDNTQQIGEIVRNTPIFAFYVVVFAPILEEYVFRKAIFGYFYDVFTGSKEFIRFTLSALIAGLCFAIPHDGISPLIVVYVAMSFVFSYLYKATGRISAPIIAHSLMNLAVVLVQVYLVK